MGKYAFQFGRGSRAGGDCSVAFGCENIVSPSGQGAFVGGVNSIADGPVAFAFGYDAYASHETVAMGVHVSATNEGAVAFGGNYYEIPEGYEELLAGRRTVASGKFSFAAGLANTASGYYSVAAGALSTAGGDASVAMGGAVTASGDASVAVGSLTAALGESSVAMGLETIASGDFSVAAGAYSTAGGDGSVAMGYGANATGAGRIALGGFNRPMGPNDLFVIGNGTQGAYPGNAFRVSTTGVAYASGFDSTTGADYAEMFEWIDRNRGNEDRRGYFVTLQGKYIRKANARDDVLGVVSASPSLVGDTQSEEWRGRYLRDDWGQIIYRMQKVTREAMESDPETKTPQKVSRTTQEMLPALNPAYDPNREYRGRGQRPEWAPVGLLGKMIVRDDGTCRPGGYCRPNNRGIGTFSNEGYKVLERVSADKVRILMK